MQSVDNYKIIGVSPKFYGMLLLGGVLIRTMFDERVQTRERMATLALPWAAKNAADAR